MAVSTDHEPQSVQALVNAVRSFHSRGWTPATSSNFSYRPETSTQFWVSQSGVDKAYFGPEHLMLVDSQGVAVPPESRRPSAETGLHAMIYAMRPQARAVIHVHAPHSVAYARLYLVDGAVCIQGWELQKGLQGVHSHTDEISIPVYENSQDIAALSSYIGPRLAADQSSHAFLLAGHGLYAFGSSVAEAKRHVEVVEGLLEQDYLWRTLTK
ncbi:MAG: methylthioribulose 1-phosphate dehydratase [Myxococcales bacterium]|nr:methylthioribulose 1-phosphate dehydratase [Myxococcales bacterium]